MTEIRKVLEWIEIHKAMNCKAMCDYKEEGNKEMVVAHSGGVTALELLRRDLIEEYGED